MMKEPLLISDEKTAEIERRLATLREDSITALLDIREVDTSLNLLSEEDRAIQIERGKASIRKNIPGSILPNWGQSGSPKKTQ